MWNEVDLQLPTATDLKHSMLLTLRTIDLQPKQLQLKLGFTKGFEEEV